MPKLGVPRFTYDPSRSIPSTAVMWCNVEGATRSKVLTAVGEVAEQHSIVKDISAEIVDGFVAVTVIFSEDATMENKFAFVKKLVAETRVVEEKAFRCSHDNLEASMAVSARGSSTNET